MCSIPGLRAPGSAVSVLITKVNLNPLCVLVELWANLDPERKPLYQQMRRQIQFPRERFCDSDGSPGDLCLVQIFETWYRARILSKTGPNYSLILLDEGRTLNATARTLAWGSSDLFLLPPEIEFCVLANVLPLSPKHSWSPMALEFLTSLCGKMFDGCIEDVLVPHRAFLLDIPLISAQMYEMGFAKKLTTENFKCYLSASFQLISGPPIFDNSMPISSERNDSNSFQNQNEKLLCYLYPELEARTVETVVVTEVTNPLRIFCQLKVFSHELKKLTDQITHYYEEGPQMGNVLADLLGLPCAARGNDGKWYRSILQQVLPSSTVGEVLHVDNGKKDFVQIENVRPLAAEFFRLPVVTYVCSLHGIIDKGTGWKASQLQYLKSLLLNRTLIARFEYQSLSEGVHYITLYGEGNVNMNHCFGMKERCLLKSENSGENFAIGGEKLSPLTADSARTKTQSPVIASAQGIHKTVPVENLAVHSSHVAEVKHINNPSEFWIRTQKHSAQFDDMMHDISELYQYSESTEGHLKYLTQGLLCAARSQDNNFYRAVISEVIGKRTKAFFVDCGHVELVDWYNLRALPSEYHELPALALKCALSGIRPKGGKWTQSAIVFFLKVVENRMLNVYISAKSQNLHIVHLSDFSASGETNISKMLCKAGLADAEDSKNELAMLLKKPFLKAPSIDYFDMDKGSGPEVFSGDCPTVTNSKAVFKELFFPVGSSVEVNVSYVKSPSDFWCQVAQNAGNLKLLMENLQNYYSNVMPQKPTEAACVARNPKNGLWYRGLIIETYASSDVDVLFVDYGPTQKISLAEIRPINPTFLKLKGQAFRCSVYNLVCPVDYTSKWSEMAISEFQTFVNSVASSSVNFKCTIFAVTYSSQNVLFNVVDLETPFQSVCSLLVQKGLARRGLPKKEHLPPVLIDGYRHSPHNIKTGGEEMMQVTSVENVNCFYCQLERNSDMADELAQKINNLCHQLYRISCPKTFGTLCFAKYTNGHWYRAQIRSVTPTMQVHFVDYGINLEMDESDMIPVPIEAGDIMSVPVLAVECGLSDVPEDVSSEVNDWFKKVVTDQCFRAVVVAKEQSGKFMVELYDGKLQVNLKIRRKFDIDKPKGYVSHSAISKHENTQDPEYSRAWTIHKVRNPPKQAESKCRPVKCIKAFRNGELALSEMQENARQSSRRVQRELIVMSVQPGNQQCLECSNTPVQECYETWEGRSSEVSKPERKSLPKVAQLPLKIVRAGQVSEVYVSHINTPSSFFIQMAEDEDKIYSVADKLNGDESVGTFGSVNNLKEGDLVSAVFPADGCWYRAVVRSVDVSCVVQVEFIDFGNMATISPSEISRLDDDLLLLPRLSVHCTLNGACLKDIAWEQQYVDRFERAVEQNEGKKLMCTFVEKVESVWEVALEDQFTNVLFKKGVIIDGSMSGETQKSNSASSPSDEDERTSKFPLFYKVTQICEGHSCEVYASFIGSPHYFWCQYANTNDLQRILEAAEEVGNTLESEALCLNSLCRGSPCLALFDEDEQWYRAEVQAKTDKGLSIIFVDYGNECDVDINKVKQVPPQLLETPPQAFLCLLNGFDSSQGAWDENAVDQFRGLIENEVLKITVVKVEHLVDRKTPAFQVNVECKGQLINDVMTAYWMLSTSGDSSVPACTEQCTPLGLTAASESASVSLSSFHLEKAPHDINPKECYEETCISSSSCIIQCCQKPCVPCDTTELSEITEQEQLDNFEHSQSEVEQIIRKEDLVVVCASVLENLLSVVTAEDEGERAEEEEGIEGAAEEEGGREGEGVVEEGREGEWAAEGEEAEEGDGIEGVAEEEVKGGREGEGAAEEEETGGREGEGVAEEEGIEGAVAEEEGIEGAEEEGIGGAVEEEVKGGREGEGAADEEEKGGREGEGAADEEEKGGREGEGTAEEKGGMEGEGAADEEEGREGEGTAEEKGGKEGEGAAEEEGREGEGMAEEKGGMEGEGAEEKGGREGEGTVEGGTEGEGAAEEEGIEGTEEGGTEGEGAVEGGREGEGVVAEEEGREGEWVAEEEEEEGKEGKWVAVEDEGEGRKLQHVTEKCHLQSDSASMQSCIERIKLFENLSQVQSFFSLTEGQVHISEDSNQVEMCSDVMTNETETLIEAMPDDSKLATKLTTCLLKGLESGEQCSSQDGGKKYVMEQACLSDKMDSPVNLVTDTQDAFSELNFAEQLDKIISEQNLEGLHSDAGPVHSLFEDVEGHRRECQDSSIMSSFGRLQAFEDEPVIGSECICWCHERNIWCKAKIAKLLGDSVKVFLHNNAEAIVNMKNVFRRASEDLPQESSVCVPLGFQQGLPAEHHEEADGSTDSTHVADRWQSSPNTAGSDCVIKTSSKT